MDRLQRTAGYDLLVKDQKRYQGKRKREESRRITHLYPPRCQPRDKNKQYNETDVFRHTEQVRRPCENQKLHMLKRFGPLRKQVGIRSEGRHAGGSGNGKKFYVNPPPFGTFDYPYHEYTGQKRRRGRPHVKIRVNRVGEAKCCDEGD